MYAYFRVFPDETHPRARYAFTKYGDSFNPDGVEMVVLDKYFNEVDDDIHVLSPLNNTDGHDLLILPNGDYVLMAYSGRSRDLSFIQTAFPDVMRGDDMPLGTNEPVQDSALQVRTPGGTVKLNWNSWDHMAIEDCITGSTFRGEYGHINALGTIDGDIIAGFRHCSKILRVDLDTGSVVWRAGPSILSREQWEAGETLQPNRGPAPLDFVNDPRGGFSGQHGGHMTADGNLLVYDNATHCGVPPGIPDDAMGLTECGTDVRTRAVEYAVDLPNDELVYQSEFRMPETDPPKTYGGFAGHAEPLHNGDWMISWSNTIRSDPPAPMPNTAMQVDPITGAEKLSMTLSNIAGSQGVGDPHHTRVVTTSPVALAARIEALTATLPPSGHTSVFHTGSADSPQVVVAFSRPVVDFAATSPSLSVTGGTIASVSAHVVAGEPTNAYLVTLTPEGDGAITFQLLTDQACADAGICTADGTTLSDVPAALVIGPPVTVSVGGAAYSVREGSTLTVPVHLSTAHRGVRGVTIPISVNPSGATSTDDYSGTQSVTFEAGHTRRSVSLKALDDTLVEGSEVVILTFGALPTGVTRGSVASSEITLTDADRAVVQFDVSVTEVAEGGETRLTFTIANGVTFEGDQTITLAHTGSAAPGDDFTLFDASNRELSPPYTITFPAKAASVYATFAAVDDTEGESAAETVTLTANLTQPGSQNTPLGTRSITIPPNDLPDTTVVTISAGNPVTEGADASFELSRSDALSVPIASSLTVPIRVTAIGSTLRGSKPSSATFAENSSTTSVQVATLDDAVVERAGEVTVLALADRTAPIRYLVGPMNSATVTVYDNDVAAFSVAADSTEVAEGSSVRVTVETVGVTFADEQAVTLTLAGTATAGQDFTVAARNGDDLLPPYRFLLPAGASSTIVTIGAARDTEDDAGETVEVSVSHEGGMIGTVAITITEAPPPATSIPVFIPGGGGPTGPTPSEADFEWTVKHDIDELDGGHDVPSGMWSDRTTLWLAHNGDGADDAVYAYDIESGQRIEDREFDLDERNRAPRGVWSDGETVWIADSGRDTLFAHDLNTGERLPDSDLALHRDNRDPRGIWSGDGIMWVLDRGADALFAYRLVSSDLLGEYALDSANGDPHGLWSDGVTIWVSDHGEKDLLAYRLPAIEAEGTPAEADLERVRDEEFTKLSRASNNSPRGVWSDGDVMYVADQSDDKVYTYNMPDAIDARLASLTLSEIEIGEFDSRRPDYEVVVPDGVTETTVEAEAAQDDAGVVIDPPDADGDETNGHQIVLTGVAEITVRVTSADGIRTKTYRVGLGDPEPEPWPHCLLGDVATGFSLLVFEGGSVDELVACAESRDVVALYALHEGVYVSYILGAPDFVNAAFRELYADGVPALTPLVAGTNGPPGEDPVGDISVPSWSECLRGVIAEGFSLVVYAGGSVEELVTCVQSRGVTAVYTLADGEWVSYIVGAPDFGNQPFRELFAEGLPATTPLVSKSSAVSRADPDREGAADN